MSFNKVNKETGGLTQVAGTYVPNAAGITYDNTESGLTTGNVQDAIDEVAFHTAKWSNLPITWSNVTYSLNYEETPNSDFSTSQIFDVFDDEEVMVDLTERWQEFAGFYISFYRDRYNLIDGSTPPTSRYIRFRVQGPVRIAFNHQSVTSSYEYFEQNIKVYTRSLEQLDIGMHNDLKDMSNFLGAKAAIFGDSIPHGTGVNNPFPYPEIMRRALGMSTMYNYAVPGAGYATEDLSPIYNVIQTNYDAMIANEVKYIFIAAGINDWAQGYELSYFREKVRSAFEKLSHYPVSSSKVFIISPIYTINTGQYANAKFSVGLYSDVLKVESARYGYNFIDGKQLGFPSNSASSYMQVFDADKVHPNQRGHTYLGMRIADIVANVGGASSHILSEDHAVWTGELWDYHPIMKKIYSFTVPANTSGSLTIDARLVNSDNTVLRVYGLQKQGQTDTWNQFPMTLGTSNGATVDVKLNETWYSSPTDGLLLDYQNFYNIDWQVYAIVEYATLVK